MDTDTETAATSTKPAGKDDPQARADAAKAAAVDALVEGWIATLRGGDIAQHTPAWNALTASLPDLKAAILKHGG